MPTSKKRAEELAFRHKLKSQMKGQWLLTWHEDRHISPGVPDASYVMKTKGVLDDPGGYCETGWLELKAIERFDSGGCAKFHVEPSQVEWIRDHGALIPVHFLVAVGRQWWLLGHSWHSSLMNIHMDHLFRYALAHGTLDTLGDVLPAALRKVTSRI